MNTSPAGPPPKPVVTMETLLKGFRKGPSILDELLKEFREQNEVFSDVVDLASEQFWDEEEREWIPWFYGGLTIWTTKRVYFLVLDTNWPDYTIHSVSRLPNGEALKIEI